ncbi:TIGR02453 family protein [Roseobacteraceae bacterium NS-SX3]
MTDPFARLIPDARAFLAELEASNSRSWFTARKAEYEERLKAPALLLLDQVAEAISQHSTRAVSTKLFRPQRDVRFSKDKTPYHTHLHMMWTLGGPAGCALFFGIAPGYCTAGGGIMGFAKAQLPQWRAAADGRWGDELAALERILTLKGLAPKEPELKRVPAPYPQTHPHGELLRRKSLTFWHEMPEPAWQRPQAELGSAFLTLAPLFDLLDEVLAAEAA